MQFDVVNLAVMQPTIGYMKHDIKLTSSGASHGSR